MAVFDSDLFYPGHSLLFAVPIFIGLINIS